MNLVSVRLRDRLIGALMLVLLVPMGASLFYITTTVRQNVLQESAAQLREELRTKSLQILYALESLTAEHFILSRVPSLVNYVRSPQETLNLRSQVQQLFMGIMNAFPLNQAIRLIDEDGRELLRVQRERESAPLLAPARNRSQTREYLAGTQLGPDDLLILPAHINAPDDGLTLVRRLNTPAGMTGLLALDVDLERLFELLQQSQSQILVLDEAGRVLFRVGGGTSVPELAIGENYATRYPEDAAAFQASSSGVLIGSPNQPTRLIAFDEIALDEAGLRWKIVATRPLEEVLEQVAAQELISVIILGGAIVVALLIGFTLTASMLRPIVQIQRATRAAAANDWDESLRLARAVPRGDELGDLADAVSSMTQELAVIYTALEERVQKRTIELERANARLRDMDQMKSKFIADVSHELRTPLSVMRLRISLMERRPEQVQRLLPMLEDQVMRMSQLVENILDVSRLDLAVNRAPFEPVEINQALSQVIDVHSALIHEKGLALSVTLGENLPLIQGNYNQVCQVLENIVSNAVKYTPQGEIRIRSWHDPLRQRVGVTIEDTGIGISAEDLPRLFERFFRAANVSQSSIPGTGLGMAIVKEIVEMHNGGIEVESELEQGTTISIWFPAEDAPRFIPV